MTGDCVVKTGSLETWWVSACFAKEFSQERLHLKEHASTSACKGSTV